MSADNELTRLYFVAASLVAEYRRCEALYPNSSDSAQSWRDRIVEVGEMLQYVSDTPLEVASLRGHFEQELAELQRPDELKTWAIKE